MTENEARTKTCPFTYSIPEQRTSEGLGIREGGPWNCVGSACMAWRWHPLLMDEAFKSAVIKAAAELGDTSNGRHKSVQHVMARRAEYGLPTTPFDGYCGLAGTPTVKEQ